MTAGRPETERAEAPQEATPPRVPQAVAGMALRRADRLAAIAVAFVIVGAIGGGLLEIVYTLLE